MRFATHLLLLGLLVACSDGRPPLAPEQTTTPPPGPVLGPGVAASFTLALVNGAPLPSRSPIGAGEWDYGGAVVMLTAARLVLRTDGTYTEIWDHQSSLGGGSRQEFNGTWLQTGDTVRFGTSGGAASTATITADGLTWSVAGFVLTYRR